MTTPAVFLHGFLGQAGAWSQVRAQLRAPLGPVLEPALPGHGLAPWWPVGAPSFDAIVEAFVDRLDLARPALLCGYSMGARLALSIACLRPAQVAGLLLVGVDPGLGDPRERALRAERDGAQAEALERDGLDRFVDAWEHLPLFASQAALPDAARAEQRAARLAHRPAALATALRSLGLGAMPDRWPRLGAIGCPVVAVTGALDEKFTAIGRRMTLASPSMRHVVVEGVGHNVVLERPAQVAAACDELARCIAASRGTS